MPRDEFDNAVDLGLNRQNGARDPSEWLPLHQAY